MKKLLWLLIIIAFIIPAARMYMHNPVLPGDRPYADLLLSQNLNSRDFGILAHPAAEFSVYRILLFIAERVAGIFSPIILAILFLALSGLLLWNIMKKENVSDRITAITLVLFAISPFTLIASSGNASSALMILALLSFWWFASINSSVISIISIFTLASIGRFPAILAFCLVNVVGRYHKLRKTPKLIAYAVAFLFTAYYFIIPLNTIYGFVGLVEFGNINGFSLFSLMLACLGAIAVWRLKNKYYRVYALGFLTIIASFWIIQLRGISALLLALLGAYSLDSLLKRRWHIKVIKPLIILVICCGLLFAWVTSALILIDAEPIAQTRSVFTSLGRLNYAGVFVPPDYGRWVNYWSHKPVIADRAFMKTSTQASDQVNNILSSASLDETRSAFYSSGVQYVVVLPQMIGTVWDSKDSGLLFVLQNNEAFKKLSPEIWLVA